MVSVLFFAELQEKSGKEKITVETSGKTIKELKQNIQSNYDLKTINQAMVAVNEEYANDETILREGDVVAFIPPVSGG
ncbi:MAG TPA: molybdopterin converting factor subunit 1 [Bacillota bacterium]|nr:molybdopterin converting factor subunit 1 [Bacillota bacterium]